MPGYVGRIRSVNLARIRLLVHGVAKVGATKTTKPRPGGLVCPGPWRNLDPDKICLQG